MIRLILVVTALVCMGSHVLAQEIVTLGFFGGTSDSVNCRVVNAGIVPADFTIEIVNGAGEVEESMDFDDVPAGAMRAVTDTTPVISYCRVTGISKKKARVMFCIQNNIGQCLAAVSGE